MGWGQRVPGGGILGCPVVLGNAFSSSCSAGRLVSVVPQLGSPGPRSVLSPARVVLPAASERVSEESSSRVNGRLLFLSEKGGMERRLRVVLENELASQGKGGE